MHLPISSAEEYLDFEKNESIGDNLADEDVKSTYLEEKEENEGKEWWENNAEKHYSELLKYFENNPTFLMKVI